MTAPKYAINPYNCTHSSLSESIFRNDKREKETNERVNKSCFSWRIFGGARLNTQSIFSPTTCIQLGAAPFLPKLNNALKKKKCNFR